MLLKVKYDILSICYGTPNQVSKCNITIEDRTDPVYFEPHPRE